MIAVEEFFTAHVFVADRDVALADGEFPRPAWQGVLVEADQGIVVGDQPPGIGAATEGIDLIPAQVPTPAADDLARGAAAAAGEHGKAFVFQLFEVEHAPQAYDGSKDTGQQAAAQGAVGIFEARLRCAQPLEGLGQQQEGAGVLSGGKKKASAGKGTGWPASGG